MFLQAGAAASKVGSERSSLPSGYCRPVWEQILALAQRLTSTVAKSAGTVDHIDTVSDCIETASDCDRKRQTRGRRVCYGAVNQGSISFAETIPYLHLLSWFDQHYGKDRLQSLGSLNVHIVTDSQVVANWGTAAMSPSAPIPRKQCVFWAAMRHLRSLGYVCKFHWAPRLSTELNWAADLIAGLARVAMIDLPGTQAIDSMTLGQRAATAISSLDFKSPDGNPLDVYTLH